MVAAIVVDGNKSWVAVVRHTNLGYVASTNVQRRLIYFLDQS